MKTKTVYVATAPVYLTDRKGNVKVLPVGHELAARAYQDLTPNQRAKFTSAVKNVGRARFGGTARDLPVIDGVVKTTFVQGEYDLLPSGVRDLVNEVLPLWASACPDTPFPGVEVGRYNGGEHHLTWWIHRLGLPATATPMFSTSNHMCSLLAKRDQVAGLYQYNTASLLKTAERLRAGRPVFATAEQAIDRLIKG